MEMVFYFKLNLYYIKKELKYLIDFVNIINPEIL